MPAQEQERNQNDRLLPYHISVMDTFNVNIILFSP